MSFAKLVSRLNNHSLPLLPKLSRPQKTLFIISSISLFILFTVHSSQFTAKTLAQTQSLLELKQNAIQVGGNQEGWLDEAIKGNLVSGLNILTGTIPNTCFQNQFRCYAPGSGQTVGGALGTNNGLIAGLYQPPASGIQYIAQIKDNFLGKPAYAQGIGFQGLQPILPIWRSFRNIVYVLSSIVFIAIGIMIILRIKISPQAVVTIQNAIPGLITTLILVTFSYAIAGLIIDLSSLIQAIVLTVLFQGQGKNLTENIVGNGNVLFNFTSLANPSLSSIFNLTWYLLPLNAIALLGSVIGAIIGGILGAASGIIGGPLAGITALGGASIGLAAGPVVVLLITAVLVLIWQLKFFFGLIKTYVTIIFKIVIAPLEIGAGAIPGMKLGFGSWINDMIGYIAVFPVSIIFLVLANIIVEKTGVSVWQNNPIAQGGLWTPSLMNGGGLPGVLASVSGGLVPAGIGLTAVFVMSKLPDMIPQVIFSLKPSPWTQEADKTSKDTLASVIGIPTTLANYSKSAQELYRPIGELRKRRRMTGSPPGESNESLDQLMGRIESDTTRARPRTVSGSAPNPTRGNRI